MNDEQKVGEWFALLAKSTPWLLPSEKFRKRAEYPLSDSDYLKWTRLRDFELNFAEN